MKKAQITQFIIVGIILVIAVGTFLYIKQSAIFQPQIVSTEFLPVANLVINCMEQKAEQGINIMGVQGGYIYVPDSVRLNPQSYVAAIPGMITPYWYYKGENRIPTKQEMESQISRYVEENIGECINNFQGMQDQFEVNSTGTMKAETKINDESVDITLTYPLTLKHRGTDRIEEVKKFPTTANIRLGKVYQLANDIMNTENSIKFLEENTMDMIAVSGLPYQGMEFECGKQWSIESQIKPEIQNMIKYNFHYLNFKNTKYDDSGIAYFQSFYVQPISSKSYNDMSVKTLYENDYGMKLDVYPSHGDTTDGIPLDIPAVGKCLKVYHHFYTMEYPVIFRIADEKDPTKIYNFNFATPVLIDKNNAKRTYDPTIIDNSFTTITNEDYCGRAEHELTIYAEDKNTGQDIEDATVDYQCVTFKCGIGTTKIGTYDGVPLAGTTPKLTAKFPPCTNGIITVKKEGYLDGTIQQTASEETYGQGAVVEMIPLKKMDYGFVVKEGNQRRLARDDEAIYMTIENKELNYEQTIYYPTELEQFKTLQLPVEDGNYTIDLKILRNDTIIGGTEIDNWNITKEDVESSSFIGFTILSTTPEPQSVNDYLNLYKEVISTQSNNNLPKLER